MDNLCSLPKDSQWCQLQNDDMQSAHQKIISALKLVTLELIWKLDYLQVAFVLKFFFVLVDTNIHAALLINAYDVLPVTDDRGSASDTSSHCQSLLEFLSRVINSWKKRLEIDVLQRLPFGWGNWFISNIFIVFSLKL